MDVNALKDKVSAAEAKVEKCKGTIARHETQLKKKFDAAVKLGCEVSGMSETEVKAYMDAKRNSFSNEQFWAVCDITSKFDDIKGARSKLADAETILQNWNDKLEKATAQDKLIEDNCPAVIKEFLEKWKANCTIYYKSKYTEWPAFVQELRNEERQARIDCLREIAVNGAANFIAENNLENLKSNDWSRSTLFNTNLSDEEKAAKLDSITISYTRAWNWYCENKDSSFIDSHLINVHPNKLMDLYLQSLELDHRSISQKRKEFGGELLLKMVEFRDDTEAFDYLEKALEAEKKAKILDLMARIEKITGKIVDAANLHIGPKGDLEGIIIGEKGKAKINTIGAGGYNIQCFHFRTLIHEYKQKGLDSVLANAKERADEHNADVHNDDKSYDCKEFDD